jgi:streptogramin lyase
VGSWSRGVAAAPLGQVTQFTAGLNAGSQPHDIASGSDGNLWFTDQGTTPAIGRITPSGHITKFSATLNAGSLPNAIAPGPDGNVWFTVVGPSPAIGRITPSGQITEFPLSTGLPDSITSGPDGNLWFTDGGCSSYLSFHGNASGPCGIGRITPSGQITELPTTTAGFPESANGMPDGFPDAITSGPDGNVWFTDGSCSQGISFPVGMGNAACEIGRITPSDQITEFPVGATYPDAIAAGPDGNLWFTDSMTVTNGSEPVSIGRITPSGQVTKFSAGLGAHSVPGPAVGVPEMNQPGPHGITSGSDGNMWFIDVGTLSIARITPSDRISEFPAGLHRAPQSIARGPDGNLWFTDTHAMIGRMGAGTATRPFCKVPRLIRKTLGRARQLLRAAHCTLGKVHASTRTHSPNVVTSQSPSAGKTLPAGARVSVHLS